MDIYGIVGAGGFGREVAPLVQFMFDELPFHDSYKLVFIVENSESKQISGIDVLSPQEIL
ncbi:hypothetical protein LMW02_000708 [Escherichia coli]|nr:hypothetical protein [Escherichia coli]